MNSSDAFMQAVELAGENYLGSARVVEDIVRNFIRAAMEAKGLDKKLAEAEHLVRIFSGSDSRYQCVPEWNGKTELGTYIAKHFSNPIEHDSPEDVLRYLFCESIRRLLLIARASQAKGDQWVKNEVDLLVLQLVTLLTGTWEIAFVKGEIFVLQSVDKIVEEKNSTNSDS